MTRWSQNVTPENVHPEYPRPQMVREKWQNLNGLWQFAPAEGADGEKQAPFGKDLAGRILVPFPMESALSGVGRHHDKSFYRRTFTVPAAWKGQRVLLHFGAVDYQARVWVNGNALGTHVGGYDAFSFDVTDALKEGGENELIVGVTDVTAETQARGKQTPDPRGIWYTASSGIWQTVWIEPVSARGAIESLKIAPDADAGSVTVSVKGGDGAGGATVEVLEGDKVIASGKAGEAILIQGEKKLWSPETPHLYGLRVKAGDDSVASYFGLRKIEVSPDEKGVPRIKLNGKPIMQVGPLDQGYWPDGNLTAPTDEALKFDIEFAKKIGFNMIRKHVKVEPQRWYYWADKLGVLVWQDMPNCHAFEAGEWQTQFETELRALVEQHVNSPSIVMWVPLNEGWGQDARKKPDGSLGKAPYDKEGTTALANKVKSWDPTRLVNNASGWTDSGSGDVYDIHAYPGPAAPAVEKKRAIVLGEFGGLGLPVKGHLWQADKNWGYQNMGSKEELTDRYVRLLGRLWQLNEEDGLCAGVYTQTTDVEGEVNGLLTYDREVMKLDEARIREANLGKGPRIDVEPLVKTAEQEPAEWKYTTEKPAGAFTGSASSGGAATTAVAAPAAWTKPAFDDSSWKSGKSGFGKIGTPGAVVHTAWETPDIWLRREIELSADDIAGAEFTWHHDESAQVYVNGVLAARSGQHTTGYVEQKMRDDARAALKPGRNVIAVHCTQTTGGQYIDVGLVKLIEVKRKAD